MLFIEKYGLILYPSKVTAEFRNSYPPVNGQCEMPSCPNPKTGYLARLVYDHDHETGYIRGILCGYCNRDLGRYEKNIPSLGTGNIPFDRYLARYNEIACKVRNKHDDNYIK